MIEKVIEIKNVGHFVNYVNRGCADWNGEFRKVNIIYAPNGSGKTTLSTIFKSLAKNDSELVNLKHTFENNDKEHIIFREKDNSANIIFDGNNWSQQINDIVVFDINYIEEYLFAGSFVRKQNKTNLFRLLLGEQGDVLKQQLKPYRKKVINLESAIKKLKKQGKLTEKAEKENELVLATSELQSKEVDFKNFYTPIFENHIRVINSYLTRFSNYLQLIEFKWDKSSKTDSFRLLPVFKVYNEIVTFTSVTSDKRNKTASYSLSEGDKSTIALCFFLGRLELSNNPDRIVVFDDPLSSFDYSRRNSTILQLARIAQNSKQFFLLSHDMHFVYDFTKKIDFMDYINLKIGNDRSSSVLLYHNLNNEYLTGTHKDINVLLDYKQNPNVSDERKREVIRCLRPILEGIIKTKYFGIVRNDIWLGEIIEFIRENQNDQKIKFLVDNVLDLIEINDYCHTYSHGSITDTPQIIEPNELDRMVSLTLEIRLKL